MPVTRNGPKGISDFRVFLPEAIKTNPIIAPIKKAKNKAIKICGYPKTKPIKKASFTSPTPIQRPLEIRTIKKKKTAAETALKIAELKIENSLKIKN